LSVAQILKHSWLGQSDGLTKSVATSSSTSKLGSSHIEMTTALKLEELGFNLPAILQSVHSNACDQLAALWHLLVAKQKGSTEICSPQELSKFKSLDLIFENTQKKPADSAVNPLLHIAGLDIASSSDKINISTSSLKENIAIRGTLSKIERKFIVPPSFPRPQSAALPTAKRTQKKKAIIEENAEEFSL
jgi:hypothetical protein